MVRVMATGVFDLLHPGHLHYLTEAKKLGNELVVVVARDVTVRKLKREPIVGEEARRIMVEALKPVDSAILGSEKDMFDTVVKVRPDVIALGFNQHWDEKDIEEGCAKHGVPARVVRVSGIRESTLSTRGIIGRILAMNGSLGGKS
ncbi:MAG: FAD synthase [Candidatus Thermoplasmatota archaeon]|jgi:FAD synthetase|nr:FAD synthase [Candidatus Thermoplasmatota archaeon]MCL5984355.1 FAD synthase [Candidatus Thermoplasmatota archaeon]